MCLDSLLRFVEDGEFKDINVKEGDIYLLSAKTPHSPRRPAKTVGLVMEVQRREGMKDGFLWFCENCHNKLYEEYFTLTDIVTQLPAVMNNFYSSKDHRTCKKCGTVMEPPVMPS